MSKHTKGQAAYLHAISPDRETEVADAFDAWLEGQTQETKEIVRLHIFNLVAALAPRKVMFGEKSAKVLVAAVYLEVFKDQQAEALADAFTRHVELV